MRYYHPSPVGNAQHIRIEGLILQGNVSCRSSQHVVFADVKTSTAWAWGDGINMLSCTDVLVDGAFIRTSDDGVTIYAHRGDTLAMRETSACSTRCSGPMWRTRCSSASTGTPTHRDDRERDLQEYRRADVREEQSEYQGAIAISAGDSNLVRDITFEDIRVERITEGKLFNVRVVYNDKYNTSAGRGVENVVFRRVTFTRRRGMEPVDHRGLRRRPACPAASSDLLVIGAAVDDVTYR